LNPLLLNGGRPPTVVTGNYGMRKDDGWVVVVPGLGSGQIVIQLPFDPDPGAVYFVTRALGSVEPSTVDVVVVGNLSGGSAGDTMYSIPASNGGYHISRLNETVMFAVTFQQPGAVPRPYTDWFAFGGAGLEGYSAAFIPNLSGVVTVPLAGFAPNSGGGDGGHPRTLYAVSIVVTPALSAGTLTVVPRFNGVGLTSASGVIQLSTSSQAAASRIAAPSPVAGPGVGFFTAQPGGFVFGPAPAGGAILDVQVTGAGGATGPTAGLVTALVF
jgi:hypothetical protein